MRLSHTVAATAALSALSMFSSAALAGRPGSKVSIETVAHGSYEQLPPAEGGPAVVHPALRAMAARDEWRDLLKTSARGDKPGEATFGHAGLRPFLPLAFKSHTTTLENGLKDEPGLHQITPERFAAYLAALSPEGREEVASYLHAKLSADLAHSIAAWQTAPPDYSREHGDKIFALLSAQADLVGQTRTAGQFAETLSQLNLVQMAVVAKYFRGELANDIPNAAVVAKSGDALGQAFGRLAMAKRYKDTDPDKFRSAAQAVKSALAVHTHYSGLAGLSDMPAGR